MTPWRDPLDMALEDNHGTPSSRFIQLATVRPDGTPAVRTMVFRGFLNGSDTLSFATDSRTDKAAQIKRQNMGEACWYFSHTLQQFRLLGPVTFVDGWQQDTSLLDERLRLWKRLSHDTRQLVLWPEPGERRSGEDEFRDQPTNSGKPPSNFAMLLLDPHRVDFLDLRPSPHERMTYIRSEAGSWSVMPLNP